MCVIIVHRRLRTGTGVEIDRRGLDLVFNIIETPVISNKKNIID